MTLANTDELGWERLSPEIELSLGLAKLKVKLGEFVTIVKTLSGAVQHQDVRHALKEMIAEVRKSYDTVVDTIGPLYQMNTPQKFTKHFPETRAAYKKVFLKTDGLVRTHCHVVRDKMLFLQKRKGWMGNLPLLRKSYARLKGLCAEWLVNDNDLVEEMKEFLRLVNRFMDDINRRQKKSTTTAIAELQSGLQQIEDDFLSIKSKLDDLDVIGKAL